MGDIFFLAYRLMHGFTFKFNIWTTRNRSIDTMMPNKLAVYILWLLVQVVQSPTHTARHLLDIVTIGSGTAVTSVNVPPPFLSDHSMIDVALDLCCANHHGFRSTTCHAWRSFSYDDCERDLLQAIRSPPNDVHELVTAYDVTLSLLVDVHAPYRVIRRSTHPSQVWNVSDCRTAKWATRAIERAHRHCPTTVSLATWKNQFSIQRRLFHQKATEWLQRMAGALCNRSPPERLQSAPATQGSFGQNLTNS